MILDKLYKNTAAQSQTQADPVAELEAVFATEAAAPALAPESVHDSAACQQQVETTVRRMWSMVTSNPEMFWVNIAELCHLGKKDM